METQKRQFGHLTKTDRKEIKILLNKGYSRREIAKALNKNHSTIVREIKNNSVNGDYDPLKAQHKAYVKRKYSKYQGMKIRGNTALETYVQEKLQEDLSPEQIAGRLKEIDTHLPYVSYLAIYKYLYSVFGQQYCRYLPSKRMRKRKRRKKKTKRDMIPNRISIHHRPESINNNDYYGHFEGDTIVSGKRHKSKTSLSVILERKARYVKFRKIHNLKPQTNNQAIKSMSSHIKTFQSLTLDNGIENKAHEQLADDLHLQVYFCDPYCSWQKGAVENINRWIRKYVPKGSNIADFSNEYLAYVENKLNNTPRKCLNFKTPLEVMTENNLLYLNQKIHPSGAFQELNVGVKN